MDKISIENIKHIIENTKMIPKVVYVVYEFSDYGLWDMTDGKVFLNHENAKSYAESFSPHLNVMEMELN